MQIQIDEKLLVRELAEALAQCREYCAAIAAWNMRTTAREGKT